MAEYKTINTQILLLNGTQAEWIQLKDHKLSKGEPAIEFVTAPNTAEATNLSAVKVKVGDGFTTYENLPYVGDELKADYVAQFKTVNENIAKTNEDLAKVVEDLAAEVEAREATDEKVATLESTVATLGNAVFQIDATALTAVEGDDEGTKIANYLAAQDPAPVVKEGNIAIVKTLIAGDKYSYTAYAYTGSVWAAMDGNYNANNVIFPENITITQTVGNIATDSSGSATIPAAGKTIKQVFEALWTKEDESITVNVPAVSLSLSATTVTQEVGTTFARPTATLKVTALGDYQYGSKDASGKSYTKANGTNVKFSALKVGFGSNIDTATEYEELTAGGYGLNQTVSYTADADDIADVLVTDSQKTFTFCAEAHHTASDRYPVTNLGNYIKNVSTSGTTRTGTATDVAADASGNIAASAADGIEKTATFTVNGFRKPFWGYKLEAAALSDPTAITSTQVRALGNPGANSTNKWGTSATAVPATTTNNDNYKLVVPVGTKQIFFAVQKGKKSTLTITDDNALGAGVACTKHSKTIAVADARGKVEGVDTNTAEYDLWYVNLDGSFGKEGKLTLKWS